MLLLGKKPTEMSNPEAVNLVKALFSIKDPIGKREKKKICSQFKVAPSQVGDFLASQRSKVKMFIKSSAKGSASSGSTLSSSDPCIPLENKENTYEWTYCLQPSGKYRKSESPQPLRTLTSPGDVYDKRQDRRERRKVQSFENLSKSMAQRMPIVAKPTDVVQNHPLSSDDILKAKARSESIQKQNGKNIACSHDQVRDGSQKRFTHMHDIVHPSGTISHSRPGTGKRSRLDSDFPGVRIQTPCRTTQVSKTNNTCPIRFKVTRKELDLWNDIIARERETLYKASQEMPSNLSETYDREINCDDTFTPQIPILEFSEVAPRKTPSACVDISKGKSVAVIASTSSKSVLKPDPEQLAGLLKTPELVSALTSGQSAGIPSDEKMKLLYMRRQMRTERNPNFQEIHFQITTQ